MSKFIDKLTHLTRGESQSIGFRKNDAGSPSQKMVLVARLTPENEKGLKDKLAGADAGLITVSETARGVEVLEELCGDYADIIWGCWLEGASRAAMEKLTGAGGDFIVFSAVDTPLAIIEHGEAGRILEVDPSISEGILRTANTLPVDAVLISEKEKGGPALNWEHLMIFRRFADLLIKPLLVTIPARISAKELGALWEAGVSGVVVEITAKTPADGLKKIRQAIDKLEAPTPRRKESLRALIPPASRQESAVIVEEEEEDEEE